MPAVANVPRVGVLETGPACCGVAVSCVSADADSQPVVTVVDLERPTGIARVGDGARGRGLVATVPVVHHAVAVEARVGRQRQPAFPVKWRVESQRHPCVPVPVDVDWLAGAHAGQPVELVAGGHGVAGRVQSGTAV